MFWGLTCEWDDMKVTSYKGFKGLEMHDARGPRSRDRRGPPGDRPGDRTGRRWRRRGRWGRRSGRGSVTSTLGPHVGDCDNCEGDCCDNKIQQDTTSTTLVLVFEGPYRMLEHPKNVRAMAKKQATSTKKKKKKKKKGKGQEDQEDKEGEVLRFWRFLHFKSLQCNFCLLLIVERDFVLCQSQCVWPPCCQEPLMRTDVSISCSFEVCNMKKNATGNKSQKPTNVL